MGHKGFAAITAIFLILTWFSWIGEKQKEEKSITALSSSPTTTSRSITTASTSRTNTNDSQHANIEQTLRIVAQKWKTTDVNKDGLYNCIDAAVLFYKYYPDRSKVGIIINVNPKTDFNHLFNAVLINGRWIAIEPQAYATNYKTYWMNDIWGNRYDSTLNRVATESYARYAK